MTDETEVREALAKCPECESDDVTATPGTSQVCRSCDWTSWHTVAEPTEVRTEAEQFFYEHAGRSWHPETETEEQGAIRGARELAAAEAEGKRRGWWVSIEHDPEGPMEDDVGSVEYVESGEGVCLEAFLWADRDVPLASLCDIVVSSEDDPYMRVVAAELMSQALAEAEEGKS